MSAHAYVAFIFWLLLAGVVGVHASKRGRSGFLWGMLTFFTGFIGAIIYLLVLVNDLDGPDPEENVRVCPNCSARHTGSPDYCSECGESIEAEDETSITSIIRSGSNAYCGNCNTKVEFDADDCPNCGSVF